MWLFSKMHSAGLDLVLIDLITQTGYLRRELIRESWAYDIKALVFAAYDYRAT